MKKQMVVVGLGGLGCEAVDAFARKYGGDERVFSLLFDMDEAALRCFSTGERCSLASEQSFRTVMEQLGGDFSAWLPVDLTSDAFHRAVAGSPDMAHGAGLFRLKAVAALAFFFQNGGQAWLDAHLAAIAEAAADGACDVYMTASLVGGTGSGLLLPLSFYIARALAAKGVTASFYALLATPHALMQAPNKLQSIKQQGNAYATLRELDAVLHGKAEGEFRLGATEDPFFGLLYPTGEATTASRGLFSQVYLVDRQPGLGSRYAAARLMGDMLGLFYRGLLPGERVAPPAADGAKDAEPGYTFLSMALAEADPAALSRYLARRTVSDVYKELADACGETESAGDRWPSEEEATADPLYGCAEGDCDLPAAVCDRLITRGEMPCGHIGERFAPCVARRREERRDAAVLMAELEAELEAYDREQRTAFRTAVGAAVEGYLSRFCLAEPEKDGSTPLGLPALWQRLQQQRAALFNRALDAAYAVLPGEEQSAYLERIAAAPSTHLWAEVQELCCGRLRGKKRLLQAAETVEQARDSLVKEWEERRLSAVRALLGLAFEQMTEACRLLAAQLRESAGRLGAAAEAEDSTPLSCSGHVLTLRYGRENRAALYEGQRNALRAAAGVGAALPLNLAARLTDAARPGGLWSPDGLAGAVAEMAEGDVAHVLRVWEESEEGKKCNAAGLIGGPEKDRDIAALPGRLSYGADAILAWRDGFDRSTLHQTARMLFSLPCGAAVQARLGIAPGGEAFSRLMLLCGCPDIVATAEPGLETIGNIVCVRERRGAHPSMLQPLDETDGAAEWYRGYLQCCENEKKYGALLWCPHIVYGAQEVLPHLGNKICNEEKIC